ncbi:MAG: FkbM family methyltransferase [Thermodesulfobacteriota bacterium]|jgi:FkbM family methyltransferase
MESVEIQGGIGKGMKMMLHLRNERHYYFGLHELDVQSALSNLARSGMVVYNIGANLGFFTLLSIKLVKPGGKVIAFEPNPLVRERLHKNLSLNVAGYCIRVEEWALNDFDGEADFSLIGDTQSRFLELPGAQPDHVIRVGCKRLDTYVDEMGEAPDLIMMDVEHAEGQVFRGMEGLLRKHKPPIIVEMHGPDSISDAWNELNKVDYSLTSLSNFKRINSLEEISYGHYLAAPTYFSRSY